MTNADSDISPTLEKDLATFAICKRNKKQLFEKKLYRPIKYIFCWLIKKQYSACRPDNLDDIRQSVMLRVYTDFRYYRPNKGRTAISFLRLIISQEIYKQMQVLEKYYSRNVDYQKEDDNRIDLTRVEHSISDITEQLSELKQSESLTPSDRINIDSLIQLLHGQPLEYVTALSNQRVRMIQQHSNQSLKSIRKTLSGVKQLYGEYV